MDKKESIDRRKYSPRQEQLQTLKKIMMDENEKQAFLDNPKKYVTDRNVMISEETVQEVMNAVMADSVLDEEVVKKYSPKELESLRSMREFAAGKRVGPAAAVPVAVAAVSGVVVAAAAVVTMVVTLTRAGRMERVTPIMKQKQPGIDAGMKNKSIKRER